MLNRILLLCSNHTTQPKAKAKSWFQILAAMRAVDEDWSISQLVLDEAEASALPWSVLLL